ncbi:hypothetical protein IWQ60_005715 [Tieghemiomyces parasiticus]|uniref:Uncharacterized protein n=1 Tax=Tieghemiomyces parasiticus TaxID=78921 RepID=A0A9W8DY84_9FUNG|nr:hypothetical protein IWQ60_005715 [Tieghemiomyces parasiticus]
MSAFKEKLANLARTAWRRTRYRRGIYFCIILAVWFTIVPPVYVTYLYQGGEAHTTHRLPLDINGRALPADTPTANLPADRIELTLVAEQADLTKHRVDYYMEATPFGKYRGGSNSDLAVGLTAYYGPKDVVYKAGNRMAVANFKIPVLGYPRMFPFDQYTGRFEVTLLETASLANGSSTPTSVPFIIRAYSDIQLVIVSTTLSTLDDYPGMVIAEIVAKRTPVTLGFCFVVVIIMWGLALTVATLAFQIVLLRATFGPQLVTASVTLMFSLPGLRNAQPGVPALGCASDMLSFLW